MVNFLLKLATMVKELLLTLSQYPGLGFLRPVAKSIEGVTSPVYQTRERIEKAKRQMLVTKNKAKGLVAQVTPKGSSKSSASASSAPAAAASSNPAAERAVAVANEPAEAVQSRGRETQSVPRGARPAAASLEEDQPSLIAPAEREEQLARLEYVCQWLREARQSLCGVNGVLALLPLETIEAGPRENAELQQALRADLTALQDQLRLRFPATALLVGLEDDRGFEELVRRVGPQRAVSQRFGHRFDVRATATADQLAALCTRISGVFEDWVYAIYRERGSTTRPGNSHLFGLLCKVRTQLQERLLQILCGGFGHDPQGESSREPLAFSGCYFAATGRTEDRRAFVGGVFDKLIDEQDHVEWTRQAQVESRRYRRLGWLALLAAALLGIGLLVSVVLRRP